MNLREYRRSTAQLVDFLPWAALVDEGIVTPEQIDDMARRFIAPRMCVTGLLQQKDINGLDTHTYAQRSLRPVLCNDTSPSKILEEHFARGEFGLKTGRGFYDWQGADPAAVRLAAEQKVARIIALMRDIEAADHKAATEGAPA